MNNIKKTSGYVILFVLFLCFMFLNLAMKEKLFQIGALLYALLITVIGSIAMYIWNNWIKDKNDENSES